MAQVADRKLRYAMIGGGRGALIGGTHRMAAALDGQIELVAGAFSSDAERARLSGQDLYLAPERVHSTWQQLLADELKRPTEERVDFVSIVTPNHLHFPIAKAFVEAGFHVVCDKPLVHTLEQALELQAAVQRQGTLFAVTYNYTGYPMVRHLRHMVQSGQLGTIRKVMVHYHQGWLSTALEQQGHKQASWRLDPAQSGLVGAIGDIGSHAENLVSSVTGLELEAICADLTAFGVGRRLEDDGTVLLRFKGGARGVLSASQICTGHENDLQLMVAGTEGSVIWRQEQPQYVHYLPLNAAKQRLSTGSPELCEAARLACRLPGGHPEGFIEAFANIYAGFAAAIRAKQQGKIAGDYPSIEAGVRGVRFIERVVVSAHSLEKWTNFSC